MDLLCLTKPSTATCQHAWACARCVHDDDDEGQGQGTGDMDEETPRVIHHFTLLKAERCCVARRGREMW